MNKSKSDDVAAFRQLKEPYSLMTFLLPVFNIDPVHRVSNMVSLRGIILPFLLEIGCLSSAKQQTSEIL